MRVILRHTHQDHSRNFLVFFSMWSLKNNEKINQRIGGQVQLSTMNTDRTRDYIIILLKLIISSKTNDAVISTGKWNNGYNTLLNLLRIPIFYNWRHIIFTQNPYKNNPKAELHVSNFSIFRYHLQSCWQARKRNHEDWGGALARCFV